MAAIKQQPIKKAVIAAAGFGTRFLPQTKAMPKEMLPLIDKPIIQYIVEELVEAGIEDIIIVTGYHKRSIEDHFDEMSADLKFSLQESGKTELLKTTQAISDLANFVYIRQKGPYGNATPVLNAEHLLGDEPFIYTFADDFIVAKPSRFQQMMDAYVENDGGVLSCVRVSKESDYSKYGIVAGESVSEGTLKVSTIVEKPGKADAPSDLASVAAYVLTPDIFTYLHQEKADLVAGSEFYIQGGMQRMIDDGGAMYALEIADGRYYDTGNKLEYMKTLVDFGLQHDDIKDEFAAYLKEKS